MAEFNVVLKGEEYRRCLVNSERALFHRWCEEDTLLINPNTTVSKIYALVEFENGLVKKVEPTDVKFVDGERLFKDYAW